MNPAKKPNLSKRIFQFYFDLKIIWKLIIGFGLIILAVVFIVLVSRTNINKLNENVNSLIDNEMIPLVYLADIRSYIGELEFTTKDALLNKDEVAVNYIRNVYLPGTVRKTVDYSFTQLIENASRAGKQSQKQRWLIINSIKADSDRRMANETAQVLKELQGYWVSYYNIYQQLLENTSIATDPEFVKEEKRLRYFLVGGIDRLVETYYRQRAIIAKTEAAATFEQQQVSTGILLMIAVVLALAVSVITAFIIVTPLSRLAAASRKIAAGDLKVVLPENRRDEVGEVSQCFNLMTNELILLIEKIKIAADNVHENSRKLLDGTYMATSVTQQLMQTLSQVAIGANTQQQRVTSINDAIQTVANFSLLVSEVTHRVEEFSSDSVSKALRGESVANEAVAKMKRTRQFMITSTEMMNQLHALSEEIGGMVLTVKEIGEQINLLALNAAIEAARAGESGRGFSVVAESIGELADRTKKATTEVQDLVIRIQQTFTKLSGMIQTEHEVMREGEQAVGSLYELFESIIASAKQVNRELGEVTNYTLKLTMEHTEVLKAIGQITEIAVQHKTGTEQAATAAVEHFSFTREMISSSQVLAHWGENLLQAVNKFKIGPEKAI